MDQPDQIAERAVALAARGSDRDGSAKELIRLAGGNPGPLHDARNALVLRVRQRSDDFAATGALSLVNAAITQLGWIGDYTWKPRGQK